MKISLGTIGLKTTFRLRIALIPWVEKKRTITCLKNRDYSSSSVPVRYIPKKTSQNKGSETVKVSKRKDFFEFSEASPPLNNEVGYGGNFVQKGFDFDTKPRHRNGKHNLHINGSEQDSKMEETEDVSEEDNIIEEREVFSTHQRCTSCFDQDVFQPLKNKPNNVAEKFAKSQGGNVLEKSFNFDAKPQYWNQMPTTNLVFNDAEKDNVMEELEEASDDDDVLEEREDELDDELMEDFNIHQQKRYGKQDVLKPWENKTKYDAVKVAAKLLAKRAFTTVELRKKLCGKRFSPDIVEAVISDFQSRGLLNDSWFAEAFCQSKWSSSTWGPRRIKQELSRKGIRKVDSEKAIEVVFKDGESDEYQESSQSLSKASMDRLLVQASKQWLRGHDVPRETRKARIIRWLLYRGFTWDVIGSIVKRLESNHQP